MFIEELNYDYSGKVGITLITDTVPTDFPTKVSDVVTGTGYDDLDIAPGSIIKVINSSGLVCYMLSIDDTWYAF